MNYVISNNKLMDQFDVGNAHMLLVDKNMNKADVQEMIGELEDVKGVKAALAMDSPDRDADS